jgi:integrase/recombinase XerD
MLVRVRQGKGGQDRFVPLAARVLEVLRAYWQHKRPHPWAFPARHRSAPLAPTSLHQDVHSRGAPACDGHRGLSPSPAALVCNSSVGTGGSRRVMQEPRGHKSPRTTARDTHLTPPALEVGHATINALMAAR